MYRFSQFMAGRYGLDPLNIALLILGCAVTFILTLFIPGKYAFLRFIGLVPYVFFAIRAFSTDIDKRQRENESFMKTWLPIYGKLRAKYRQFKDKEHRYYKCPECKHVLRVPRGKGKIEISCPFCGRKFKKRT